MHAGSVVAASERRLASLATGMLMVVEWTVLLQSQPLPLTSSVLARGWCRLRRRRSSLGRYRCRACSWTGSQTHCRAASSLAAHHR